MSDTNETAEPVPATLKEMREFFDTPERPMNGATFRQEFAELSTEDKLTIRAGIGDGSLTY